MRLFYAPRAGMPTGSQAPSSRTLRRSFVLCHQMKIMQKVGGNIAAQRNVALTAVSAEAGDLDRALIQVHVVDLICFRRRMGPRDRNVDRSINRDADIDKAARE